jgi:hypothetical protein
MADRQDNQDDYLEREGELGQTDQDEEITLED